MADPELVLQRGIGNPTKCRSCPTKIIFAATQSNTKVSPWQEDPAGAWVVANGVMRHVGKPPETKAQTDLFAAPASKAEPGPTRYTSHFEHCPAADKHRRRR